MCSSDLQLSAEDEQALLERHMNRVTDTCIPEGEAMRRMETAMLEVWTKADQSGQRFFPHEFFYQVLLSGKYREFYQIDPKNSWMLAAAEKNLPIIVPGWEDATLGNMYAAAVIRGDVKNVHTVRTGIEYMTWLADFYTRTSAQNSIGMFQIGGGIAGEAPRPTDRAVRTCGPDHVRPCCATERIEARHCHADATGPRVGRP